ncbi:MAG: hypothetical protein IJT94_07935, partial [Oscillibacter sp.]|nr:hypothetical protein [Oscillibacter sp.]
MAVNECHRVLRVLGNEDFPVPVLSLRRPLPDTLRKADGPAQQPRRVVQLGGGTAGQILLRPGVPDKAGLGNSPRRFAALPLQEGGFCAASSSAPLLEGGGASA